MFFVKRFHLLLFLFLPSVLSAQQAVSYTRGATQLEDILPSSPEAASRVRYADVPFTHSLGASQYSVPLWELKGRELSLPISLEYSSNGIRLDEIAGVAGLGWALNAGGCITRDVVYMPDEYVDGTFRYTWPDSDLLAALASHASGTSSMTFLHNVLWNRTDTNADRYRYDFCGLKGSFILDPTLNVIQLQGPGVKIEVVPISNSTQFTFRITGPDGTVYRFTSREEGTHLEQGVENSSFFTGNLANWTATTAWYLTSVTSRDGTESAFLNYDDGGTWDRSTGTLVRTLTCTPGGDTSGFDESVSVSTPSVSSTHSVKVLRRIILAGFTATFTYDTESSHSNHTVSSGSDWENYPRRLKRVTVAAPSGVQLYKAEVSSSRDPFDGRILLNGVDVYRGGVLSDRWSFSYNTLTHTVSRLSQDWFGYYNGETSRLDLCPYEFVPGSGYSIELRHGAPSEHGGEYMTLRCADHDGARTVWEYERATSGENVQMTGTTVASSVGVRVSRILVYAGDSLCRVRQFSYSDPATTTPVYPLPEYYLRTSGKVVQTLGGNFFGSTGIRWTFSLYETPVTDGLPLQGASVWYGTVTEDDSPSLLPCGHRTVYTYSTAAVRNFSNNTQERFPQEWADEYGSAATGVEPFNGVQSWYVCDGASERPQLTGTEFFKGVPSSTGGFSSVAVEKHTTSYSGFGRDRVFCGYKVVKVMERMLPIAPYENDLQHYPLYCESSLGYAATQELRSEYLPSGTDTTTLKYVNVARSDPSTPIRRSEVRLRGSDADRIIKTDYADTWGSDAPSWVGSLAAQHALSDPLRERYITRSRVIKEDHGIPFIPFPLRYVPPDASLDLTGLSDTVSVVHEYALFGGRLMPSAIVEYHGSLESWRDAVLERNALGNPVRLKSKGSPETSLVWSYGGLYPVAAVSNASYADVVSSLGGRMSVDDLEERVAPTAAERAAIEALRSGTAALPRRDSVQVSTFSFIPGVGVEKIVDPSGVATSYTYTLEGHLKEVRNTLGEKEEEWSYRLLNAGDGRLYAALRTYRTSAGDVACSSVDSTLWNSLGRRTRVVRKGASGDGLRDLVTRYEGDYMLHDDVRVWAERPSDSAPQTPDAYYGKEYERSSRERIVRQSLPGYSAHSDSLLRDALAGFPVVVRHADSLACGGNYGPGQLEVEGTLDADGRTVISVRDHAGRLLATARDGATLPAQMTRFVYDKGDRLALVAGPGVALSDTVSTWRYSYDSLGRLASKGVPGAESERYSYDAADRLIAVRRADGLKEYAYDAYGRIRRAWFTPAAGGMRLLTEEHTYDRNRETAVRLLCTAGADGAAGYAFTTYAYDTLGRVVRTVTDYPDGQRNSTTVVYDFSGNPAVTTISGVRPGTPAVTDSLRTAVSYDLRERPVSIATTLFLNGTPAAADTTVIAYDTLGRRSAVSSGPLSQRSAWSLQDYPKGIVWTVGADTLFAETLHYEDVPAVAALAVPSYTGKITKAEELWKVPPAAAGGGGAGMQAQRSEQEYAYDSAGRLAAWDDGSRRGETFTYDGRSNLLGVAGRHTEPGTLPQTESYSYVGERLSGYSRSGGTAATFTHDALGRMSFDGTAGAAIAYNHLDLPGLVSVGDTVAVRFSYLEDGTKLAAVDTVNGDGLLYRGPFVYRLGAGGTGRTLECVPFGGGRLTPAGALYHVTDHLGSVRAVVTPAGAFLSLDDYAPYGARTRNALADSLAGAQALVATPAGTTLRYRYTGKEDLGPDFGLGYHDFGARHYSATLRRWLVPDSKSEDYYGINPYVYCAGEPVRLVDTDGRDWYSITVNWPDEDNSDQQIVLYHYTKAKSQEELDKLGIKGRYLGEAVVLFRGALDERLGSNNTLLDDDAISAKVTIYGINGQDDIRSYDGLSVSSNREKYPMIEPGEYRMFQQQMKRSSYKDRGYNYRIITMDGNENIPPVGGKNIATGKNFITEVFFHRTDLNGKAGNASKGCLVIDGRQWKNVDEQLKESKNIYLLLTREIN